MPDLTPKFFPLFEDLNRINGALLIHKTPGPTSFGVISELQRALTQTLGIKRKELPRIGHGGTLDPFAEGLLVLLLGNATKLSTVFLSSRKTYRATARFGEKTESGDHTNPIIESSSIIPESIEQIQAAMVVFENKKYVQKPPMHSAIKVDGRPLYQLAHKGVQLDAVLEQKARECTVYRFNALHYSQNELEFDAQVSSGTYVRTLAEDLACKLGSLAHLTRLIRMQSGNFRLQESAHIDDVVAAIKNGVPLSQQPCFIEFDDLMKDYPQLLIPPPLAKRIQDGDQVSLGCVIEELNTKVGNSAPSYPDNTKVTPTGQEQAPGPGARSKTWATLKQEDDGRIFALLCKESNETDFTLSRIFRTD